MEVNVSSDQAMMQDQDGVEVSIEIVLDSIIKKTKLPKFFLSKYLIISAQPPSSIRYCLNKTDKTRFD